MNIRSLPSLLLTLILLTPLTAAARTAPSSTPTGNDVSYPQCSTTLPKSQAFGLVGVNNGTASTQNPCFSKEWTWAKSSTGSTNQPHAQLYVNTANPADVLQQYSVTDWPTMGTTPYGECAPTPGNYNNFTDNAACSYVYGQQRATADIAYAQAHGVVMPAAYTWYLDVESSNSWTSDPQKNAASLEGMTDYFKAQGQQVGLYSTKTMWSAIGFTDTTGSLNNLPNWLPGATTLSSAEHNCSLPTLLGSGYVSMTQYTQRSLDYDYSCTALPSMSHFWSLSTTRH